MRFGIGNDFPRGGQVDYVLGKWSDDDLAAIQRRTETTTQAIQSFVIEGLQRAMNKFNGNFNL